MRLVAVVVLFVVSAACGPTMSPADAYGIEIEQCHRDHVGDAEGLRRCLALLDRKYGRFLNEGEYPQ